MQPSNEHPEHEEPRAHADGDVPQPSGPPVPVEQSKSPVTAAVTTLTLLAAGGMGFVLIADLATPCVGATRSSRLQWEQRQVEIDRAIEETTAYRQAPSDGETDPTHE